MVHHCSVLKEHHISRFKVMIEPYISVIHYFKALKNRGLGTHILNFLSLW